MGGSGYTFDVRQDPLNKWALAYQVPPTTGDPRLKWAISPFIADSNYVFTNTVSTSATNVKVQVRLFNRATDSETNLTSWVAITPNTAQDIVVTVNLPPDIKLPELRLYAKDTSGANPRLFIEHMLLQPLSTHHRVTAKTVKDGLGGSNDWTYSYTGISTNTPDISDAANQTYPRHPKYSQFRGHAKVTVTATDGNQTVNFFAQDDLYLGKATKIRELDAAGNYYCVTLNEFGHRNYATQEPARGNSVCFGYDSLNRATTKTARTGTSCASSPIQYSVTFGYDDITNNNKGLGRRTSLSDSSDVVHPRNNQTWKYDLQGHVVSTAQTIPGAPATYTTAFSYDAMDRVRTMTYPDNEVVTSAYNNQGLPLNLVNNDPTPITYAAANAYNAASQLTQLAFGNNAVTN